MNRSISSEHGFKHVYRELELNLRIKPRKRLRRDGPEALAVPDAPNMIWPMDFMAERLEDGGKLLKKAFAVSWAFSKKIAIQLRAGPKKS